MKRIYILVSFLFFILFTIILNVNVKVLTRIYKTDKISEYGQISLFNNVAHAFRTDIKYEPNPDIKTYSAGIQYFENDVQLVKSTESYFLTISRFSNNDVDRNIRSFIQLFSKELQLLDQVDIQNVCDYVEPEELIFVCYNQDIIDIYRTEIVNQKLLINSVSSIDGGEYIYFLIQGSEIIGETNDQGMVCKVNFDTLNTSCIDKPQKDLSVLSKIYSNALSSAEFATFKVIFYEPKLDILIGYISDWYRGSGTFLVYKENKWFYLDYLNLEYEVVPFYVKWRPNDDGTKLLGLSRDGNILRVIEMDLIRMSVKTLDQFDVSGKTIMHDGNNVLVVDDYIYFFNRNGKFAMIPISICNNKIHRSTFDNSIYFFSDQCKELLQVDKEGRVYSIGQDMQELKILDFFHIEHKQMQY